MSVERPIYTKIDPTLFEPEHFDYAESAGLALYCDLEDRNPRYSVETDYKIEPCTRAHFILTNPEMRKIITVDSIKAHRLYLQSETKMSQPEIELLTLKWEQFITTDVPQNLQDLPEDEKHKMIVHIQRFKAFTESSHAALEGNPKLQYIQSDYEYVPKTKEQQDELIKSHEEALVSHIASFQLAEQQSGCINVVDIPKEA